MILRLHRPVPLVVAACLVSVGCYGDVELEACTISETYCDDAEHTAGPGSSSAAVTDGSASPATTTDAGSNAGATDTGTTGSGGDTGSGETSGDEAGLPIDLPPAVWDLVCDPEIAAEVGPYQCTYQVSPDALEADLLDDGVVVATGPAGAPLVFPVTSAPHNNPGSELAIVVRDAAGQTAKTSVYHPAVLLDPGSKVWTTQEPNDGPSSIARAVALQAGYVITAGSHLSNGKLVGTLRRYDKAGQYIASAEGWTRTHTDWTAYPELKTAALTLMGVAVDAEQNIITVGTAYINDEPRMYVARFHADGTLALGGARRGPDRGPRRGRAAGRHDLGRRGRAHERRPGAVGPRGVGLRPGQAGPRPGHLQRPPRRLQQHAQRTRPRRRGAAGRPRRRRGHARGPRR
jgi:hypothetical protein